LFPNLEVTVLPDGEGWKVVLPKDVTIEADRFETVLLIADRLRSQFDLNDTPSRERATPSGESDFRLGTQQPS
jgi:hypothetical protein